MRNYYETLSKMCPNYFGKSPKINRSNLLWQKNISTKSSETARYSATRFGLQLADCKMMPKAKKMPIEYANHINDDLHLLKAGDDYWKKAIHSWAQGQERRHEHLAVHVGQQIEEIRGHVEIQMHKQSRH
jgi:hypothetical protein